VTRPAWRQRAAGCRVGGWSSLAVACHPWPLSVAIDESNRRVGFDHLLAQVVIRVVSWGTPLLPGRP